MGNRYVLCRPLGGLNDMLSQIARTHQYAIKSRRQLVVETQSNPKFGAVLTNYLRSRTDILFVSQTQLQDFDTPSCYPIELTGRVSTYALCVTDTLPFREVESNIPVTFDFTKNYAEDLIIHHQPGGGLNSVYLLDKLTLNDRILAELARRKQLIGSHYSAIHIRDSDYKTDWQSQLANLAANLETNSLFIATDNPAISRDPFWRTIGLTVWCSADFAQNEASFDFNEEALLDLAVLAEAEELWIMKLDHSNVTYSGYSLLAKYLWSVRKMKRVGLAGLLRSKTLFTDFHGSETRLMRLGFFCSYWMPKIIASAKKSDFLGA